jgi:spore photoproduct lyase
MVVSFSINAVKVAETWEKAPDVASRLDAAKKLSDSGIEVRLRIDPMVPIDGWKLQYGNLLKMIFSRFKPSRLTIGSLRGLQSTINNARDKSWTVYLGEKSNWGRKIDAATRFEMYSYLINRLSESYQFTDVALCKETVEMWEKLGLDYKKIRCNCTL